jgi:hypothetical protein
MKLFEMIFLRDTTCIVYRKNLNNNKNIKIRSKKIFKKTKSEILRYLPNHKSVKIIQIYTILASLYLQNEV